MLFLFPAYHISSPNNAIAIKKVTIVISLSILFQYFDSIVVLLYRWGTVKYRNNYVRRVNALNVLLASHSASITYIIAHIFVLLQFLIWHSSANQDERII